MFELFKAIIDAINNSKFLSVLVSFIIIIFAINFITYIVKLFGDIRSYIVNKSNSYYLANQKNTRKDNSTLPMPDRIELTNDVLDLISFMINNEIVTEMKTYISLSNPYVISNIDKDAATIAERVFKGINENLFTDPDLVLTKEYLISFITKKTLTTLLDVTQQHNSNLRNPQSVED